MMKAKGSGNDGPSLSCMRLYYVVVSTPHTHRAGVLNTTHLDGRTEVYFTQ